jgi:hypothetical protein
MTPAPTATFSGRERGWAIGALALTVLLTIVATVRVLRAPKAIASAIFHGDFPAAAAIEGDLRREWLLPDKTAGWLDLYFSPDREVGRLHIVNAQNAPHNDRGTVTLRVEVYFDDELRKTQTVAFEGPTAKEVDVEIGAKADRIRLVVESWSGLGGGLAEVEVL